MNIPQLTKLTLLLFLSASCQSTKGRVGKQEGGAVEPVAKAVTSCSYKRRYAPQKFKRKILKRLKRGSYDGNYEDESLADIMIELADKAGISIVVEEGLGLATVTASFEKKSFVEALRIVLFSGPYDYRYYPREKLVFVGRVNSISAVENWQLNQYFAYRTRFTRPSEITKTILKQYAKYVHGDDAAGIVSITAPGRVIASVVNALGSADRPRAQVLLHLNIIEFEEGMSKQIGKKVGAGGALSALDALSPIAPAFRPAILSGDGYRSFLDSVLALHDQNSVSIKAQPKIMAQDGQVAIFQSNRKILFGGGTNRNRTGFTEVPTGLEVRPTLLDNGVIQLDIKRAVHSEVSRDSLEVHENSIKTMAAVRLGDAVIIGGMIHKREHVQIRKLPVLGDIPWLGWLFRSESRADRSVETVFTIKPELVCHDKT